MTSSPDREHVIEPLPPALSSMWRLCKLGYRHEPRLMVAAFALSQLAALPDALLALWLMLLGEGVLGTPKPVMVQAAAASGSRSRPRRRGFFARSARACSAASATGDHRARSPRRASTGFRRHRRAPGTAGVSRPAVHAARTRSSCWTTCTCRCFPRWAGSCVWA